MRRVATFTCEDCGKPTTRRRQAGRPEVCLECGISRSYRNALYHAEAARLRRQSAKVGGNTGAGVASS